jgi:catechol 2,3-dioxygenase-like lactoylglutathione lyase family enzyme
MLRPKALHHVALTVTDMDKTLLFYQALGLTHLRGSGPGADGGRSAVLRIGGQELNVFHTPGLVAGDDANETGMHHYCLDMDAESMDALIADLGEAGLPIVRGPVKRRDGTSVFVHDPDGVRVELRIGQ